MNSSHHLTLCNFHGARALSGVEVDLLDELNIGEERDECHKEGVRHLTTVLPEAHGGGTQEIVLHLTQQKVVSMPRA